MQSLSKIRPNPLEYIDLQILAIDDVDQFLLDNKMVECSKSIWNAWKESGITS
jgi:hypothetical protein